MKTEIPNEEELIAMSHVFDEFMSDFCVEYGMSPLEATGLFFARMTRLAQDFDYSANYGRLLKEIVKMHENTQTIMANNTSSAVH